MSSNENADKVMTAAARNLFSNNDFTDKQIVGHPNNDFIPQPNSIRELRQALVKLKTTMTEVTARISKTSIKGKVRHPGFEYLHGEEWLQLACMHFRHHLQQKASIDDYLQTSKE